MKIAYVHDVIYPYVKGGAEKRVWEISKRLVDRGHEVHVFGMKYWGGDDVLEHDGVYLHGVCGPKELYVNGKRSIKTSVYFSWKLLSFLEGDFDVIDAQQFPYFPCFSAKYRSLLGKTPLAITWHEVWGDYWYEYLGPKGIFGKGIEKWTTRLPDKIIPVSQKVMGDLCSIGVDEDNMEMVPNGVDISEIQKINGVKGLYDVLYAGRLLEHKNVDLLLKAISLIRDYLPSVKCGIIGDGPERERLSRLARDLNLERNIEFLGFLERYEDVIATMKSSKVFVLPSTREGFGIVLLEANACGLPAIVVKSERNAAFDLIDVGLNGFVCDLSAESMAKAILKVLAGDSYEYISTSSKNIAKKYDWAAITNKIELLYDEMAR